MVRHKTRWLLVRIDFADDLQGLGIIKWDSDSKKKGEPTDEYPSKKDLAKVIRNSVVACSGVAASGAALDTQVRFCDATTGCAMVRVPREFYGLVRSAVSFVTTLQNKRVVLSCLSVNGSARTAKVAAMKQVRSNYRERILLSRREANATNTKHPSFKDAERICRKMEETLSTIQSIDY